MPLPALPPSNTPRMYIRYTSKQVEHEMVVRLDSGQTSADAITRYTAARTALLAQITTSDSLLGADFSAQGSNIRFPLAVTGGTGTQAYTPGVGDEPIYVSVTGRSLDGRKTRLGMFAPSYKPSTYGYRISGLTGAGTALYALLTGAALSHRSISGGAVQWNNYLNIGLNDHWVGQERTG